MAMSKELEFQFDSNQDFQIDAINSIVKVFEGQPLNSHHTTSFISTNSSNLDLVYEEGIVRNVLNRNIPILENIQKIQTENNLDVSEDLVICEAEVDSEGYKNSEIINCPYNFTIEMETGTGKTYTYIRTCYELNKVYGFKKFVIVVPSVAIREGVIQALNDTHKHFQLLYSNVPINFTLFDSSKKTQLQQFSKSPSIEILVINIDSFTKESNIINKRNEYGNIPITYIQKCKPIVIVDEPQNMETDIRKGAILNLNPLCTLRYSATHRNYYNLLYSLNPVQAYDLGLVKQIEVDGITVGVENNNSAYIRLKGIKPSGKSNLKAKLSIYVNSKNSVVKKDKDVKVGDNLYDVSSRREMYSNGFIVESIDINNNTIKFSNGITLSLNQEQGGMSEDIMKEQIKRTIISHFEKEKVLSKKGIKVLSLFFIDKVANYKTIEGDKGKFALWFEELFNQFAPEDYRYKASQVHNGYFSQDKGNFKDTKEGEKKTNADNDAYVLIMQDKKRLLDDEVPLRFLFSHSALREGWDNPNVFQICTLNETHSEIKKRQEIGRGMRLPVDKFGVRCFDKSVNILTVIANESYNDFAAALQKEIEEETSVKFEGRIKNKREKKKVVPNKQITIENYPELFEIWKKIKFQTKYRVDYKTDELIRKSVEAIKVMPQTQQPYLIYQRHHLEYTNTGVEGSIKIQENERINSLDYKIPDIFAYIQSKIDISKKTISCILKQSGRLNEIYINPQMFLDNVVINIKGVLNQLLIDGIKYEKINDKEYAMLLLENEEIERYLSNLVEIEKQNIDKTIYNYIEKDSDVEENFINECQYNTRVKFFFKLPKKGFHIPTPVGSYYPDWAVVLEEGIKVYFIAETKSSLNPTERRVEENMKISCGRKWNEAINEIEYKVCTELSQLYKDTR